MTGKKKTKQIALTGIILILGISFLLLARPVSAEVCVKKLNSGLLLNGVVANGVTTGACSIGPVWTQVTPVEMLPAGSSPNAYMYLAYNPTAQRFYIGLDVKGDEDLSDFDAIYLLFDANNSKTFDPGDFYLKIVPVQAPAEGIKIKSGTACNQNAGTVEYYRYLEGSGWEKVNMDRVFNAVNKKTAYDYDNTAMDPETNIWNIEIDMPVGLLIDGTTYYGLQTASGSFGLGAYVFVDEGRIQEPQGGTVLKWPFNMIDRRIDQQDMGFPASLASQLDNVNLNDICYDVKFTATPWDINGHIAAGYDHRINAGVKNTFGVTFYFDGPNEVMNPLSNIGTVKLSLTPYSGSGDFTVWDMEQTVDAETYNHSKRVEFQYDFANPPASFQGIGSDEYDFVCATGYLLNFQRNDNHSNDSFNVNYNFFVTSEYTQNIMFDGSRMRSLKKGQTGEMLIKIAENNEIRRKKAASAGVAILGDPISRRQLLLGYAAILFIIIFAAAAIWRKLPQRRALAVSLSVLFAAVTTALTLWGCKSCPDTYSLDPRWEIMDMTKAGLHPVKDRPNWYSMPIKYGERKKLQMKFTGQPLPYKTVKYQLSPSDGKGNPGKLSIKVKSGTVISLVSFGEIDLDGKEGPLAPAGAAGFVADKQLKKSFSSLATGRYLLRAGYYTPSDYVGTLIGSFDNFETSFVVGRSNSILVPQNASTLTLAVNAVSGQYAAMAGYFEVYAIATPAPSVPTHTVITGDGTYSIPYTFHIDEVLTAIKIFTYEPIINVAQGGVIKSRTYVPLSSASFIIYDSHYAY